MTVFENLAAVRSTLPWGVQLVAVSKTYPAEAVRQAYDAGQRAFGENRPQELAAKAAALPADIRWHQIGHLQTNKVRLIMPYVARIESLDSARLAEALEKEASKADRQVEVLFEIQVAFESEKTGWPWEELRAWIEAGQWRDFTHLIYKGVMGIATHTDDKAQVVADFDTLRRYFEELQPLFGSGFDTLSMGMSGDYELAVAHGATSVRVGSAIFGAREYKL